MTEPTNEALAGVETAPELENTVSPASPETPSPDTPEAETPKTFSQEEVDAIIAKRVAREQRKWDREQAQRQQQAPASATPPQPADFDTTDAYVDALATQKAQDLVARQTAERQQAQVLEAYSEREEEARAKYDDFEQVAYNPSLKITDAMAQAIQLSDTGPDLIYWLGSNPKEAARISQLPDISQAREIGRLEAQIAANPPVKKTSTAPAPIAPVTARSNGSPTFDTTDPRSIKSMSTSDWIEAERQRQIKKAELRNR